MKLDIDINDNGRFIPTANGNDKEQLPIIFNHRYLTVGEQSEIEYWTSSIRSGKVQLKHNVNDIFLKLVTSIENFSIKDRAITLPSEWLALNGRSIPAWMKKMVDQFDLYIENSKDVNIKN